MSDACPMPKHRTNQTLGMLRAARAVLCLALLLHVCPAVGRSIRVPRVPGSHRVPVNDVTNGRRPADGPRVWEMGGGEGLGGERQRRHVIDLTTESHIIFNAGAWTNTHPPRRMLQPETDALFRLCGSAWARNVTVHFNARKFRMR
eukprot:1320561-Rhodomonas_salina.1